MTELQARTDTFYFGSRAGGYERHVTLRIPSPAVLTTHSFQAPGFYERLGYERKCAIEGRPKGHSNIVFVKSLEGQDGTFNPSSDRILPATAHVKR